MRLVSIENRSERTSRDKIRENRIILEELPNNRKIGMDEGYKAVEY